MIKNVVNPFKYICGDGDFYCGFTWLGAYLDFIDFYFSCNFVEIPCLWQQDIYGWYIAFPLKSLQTTTVSQDG